MPRTTFEYEQAQQRKIIEGAMKVFAEFGYRQTTMDQICNALQLSKGAIYLYFESKEALYVSALRSIFDHRFILLSGAFSESDPLQVKFDKMLDRIGDLVSRDDYVYARLSVEGFLESDHIPALKVVKEDFYNRFYTLLHDLLARGQETGQVRSYLDIPSITVVLMATLDGLMMHSLVEGRGIDPDRTRKIVSETFSHLLKA